MSSLLETITSYLPQHEGILPKWMLFLSVVALGNTIQSYLTLSYTARLYAGPKLPTPILSSNSKSSPKTKAPSNSPATPLQSRTFGTWTLIQSLVRIYAAYNISNPQFYQLAYLTYVVAWWHFMSEWWIFGTARLGEGLVFPVVIASSTLVWMWMQWGFYVQ
ncbi:probable ERG28 Protein involved in synthesis of ergosterol [Rhynchosporium agropyri]|uniref:Probable ERG28 Protein involved in synthesis of ergosterol n=2 Tax=Rhynchosporium TaxID=38037 RepID=A0A1E1LU85_RHYSE|nr:probable ERG28 Protein involved in synthesis of ergosterol [Rhynchosporium agropyri]CZT39936.1 probable ERG28 Protein involved in synthesis of ergosterol [Rhynchosporium secalis]